MRDFASEPMRDLREVLTDRLRLRPTTLLDGPLYRLLDADPEVAVTLGGFRTVEQTDEFVRSQAGHWTEHGFGWWAAFDRATGDFVGRGGLRHIELEGRHEVEVGYALVPRYWGRGLATELASAAMGVGIEVLSLARIVGVTLPSNHASGRVLEKAGLRFVRMTEHRDLPHRLYVRGDAR